MDYHFENLDPERFQQFCQALLIQEFPDIQCFPVGQPDGGRDGLTRIVESRGLIEFKGLIVFQVKFVRKPLAEDDPHNWLINILKEELPKIKKTIPGEAKKYYLLTNVPGTSHPQAGSIDRLQQLLNKELEIKSQCWWRDDLNRRLDKSWNVKWAYPELMSGVDILRYIIESGLSEDKERRITAIRNFIEAQYEFDEEVRFKQIELQNKLMDLFIDVPAKFCSIKDENKYRYLLLHMLTETRILHYDSELQVNNAIGAATLILNSTLQNTYPQIVLEGAPGQGKSTIVQYVCQVHRMNILQKTKELITIPNHLKPTRVRIPFKVDLRDFASWLGNRDPFSSEDNNPPRENWQKSLESFLAYQVKVLSGGIEFSVTDLYAIARFSDILIVLDGLDEVADISKRQEIVSVVKISINRLRGQCPSIQTVITSRPTAFINSTGFPEGSYPRFELLSITKALVNQYAERWIRARRLSPQDSGDVKKILKEKLNQPHLRELARNPMQLAILLSLINARGSSLPDKRTALYDSYIELFFNRESDKSAIVREYRDLLIEIHRYVAWYLHAEAEKGSDQGRISSEKLQKLISDYLIADESDSLITTKLFTGMLERVVVLVSRVQGTYEFEVQPLREYFAAKYLYETAPYSPTGFEKRGTKPDRFDAISRNFYWLNVTRFYAGCFSKGELPTLVDSLEVLSQENKYRNIGHPRKLAAMLLSDWVFTQNPRSMKKIIKLILDGIGIRSIFTYDRSSSLNDSLILPKNCGKDELLDTCFKIINEEPVLDYAYEVIGLIKANAKAEDITSLWEQYILNKEGSKRTLWLKYGYNLGILPKLSTNKLNQLMLGAPLDTEQLQILLKSKHSEICLSTETYCMTIVNSVLDGTFVFFPQERAPKELADVLTRFCALLNFSVLERLYHFPESIPLYQVSRHLLIEYSSAELLIDSEPSEETKVVKKHQRNSSEALINKLMTTIEIVLAVQHNDVKTWKTEIGLWDALIENLRSIWGEQWISYYLANMAAGIQYKKDLTQDRQDLLDHSKPLCLRTCYARTKSRSFEWWKKQFAEATNVLELMFISLSLFTYAHFNTITALCELLNKNIDSLAEKDFEQLIRTLQKTLSGIRSHKPGSLFSVTINSIPENLSERMIVIICLRLKSDLADQVYLKYLSDYNGTDPTVLRFCQEASLQIAVRDPSLWNQALSVIEKNYSNGFPFNESISLLLRESDNNNTFPANIAFKITDEPKKYPRLLVQIAESRCREIVASEITPVGKIAIRDEWFAI